MLFHFLINLFISLSYLALNIHGIRDKQKKRRFNEYVILRNFLRDRRTKAHRIFLRLNYSIFDVSKSLSIES